MYDEDEAADYDDDEDEDEGEAAGPPLTEEEVLKIADEERSAALASAAISGGGAWEQADNAHPDWNAELRALANGDGGDGALGGGDATEATEEGALAPGGGGAAPGSAAQGTWITNPDNGTWELAPPHPLNRPIFEPLHGPE